MSNAIKIIDEKMDQISELLRHHAYQLEVLRDLRQQMDRSTGQVKTGGPKAFQIKATALAKKVAELIREQGCSKTDAVRQLRMQGETDMRIETGVAMCSPTHIGSQRKYNKIFKGTKYVK